MNPSLLRTFAASQHMTRNTIVRGVNSLKLQKRQSDKLSPPAWKNCTYHATETDWTLLYHHNLWSTSDVFICHLILVGRFNRPWFGQWHSVSCPGSWLSMARHSILFYFIGSLRGGFLPLPFPVLRRDAHHCSFTTPWVPPTCSCSEWVDQWSNCQRRCRGLLVWSRQVSAPHVQLREHESPGGLSPVSWVSSASRSPSDAPPVRGSTTRSLHCRRCGSIVHLGCDQPVPRASQEPKRMPVEDDLLYVAQLHELHPCHGLVCCRQRDRGPYVSRHVSTRCLDGHLILFLGWPMLVPRQRPR